MQHKVSLSVLGFSFNQTRTGAYVLVLAEEKGLRRMMVLIGTPEAQAIAFQLQNTLPPRPLTHDTFCATLNEFDIVVREVFIYQYISGVFHAQLILQQGDKIVTIECRTSDAVALALRSGAPIYTTEKILQEVGVVLQEPEPSTTVAEKKEDDINLNFDVDYSLLSLKELKSLLESAIEAEDYELAALLRDKIKER